MRKISKGVERQLPPLPTAFTSNNPYELCDPYKIGSTRKLLGTFGQSKDSKVNCKWLWFNFTVNCSDIFYFLVNCTTICIHFNVLLYKQLIKNVLLLQLVCIIFCFCMILKNILVSDTCHSYSYRFLYYYYYYYY